MKHLDVMQQGGYRFDDVSIAYFQSMFNERDSFLYSVFGDKKIVKGVHLNTQTNLYSDGLITYNGKLFHFVGGGAHQKVSLIRVETKRQYEDGNDKEAFINEFFEFGENGTDDFDFSELKRWYPNQPILKEVKEVAGTVTNADLAGTGWFIADGQNGTDDLRSMFIVGVDSRDQDYNAVGKTGGEKKHLLLGAEMPKAGSSIYVGQAGDGYPNGSGDRTAVGGENAYVRKSKTLDSVLGSNNQPHENRPPYYAAIRIQFIGI